MPGIHAAFLRNRTSSRTISLLRNAVLIAGIALAAAGCTLPSSGPRAGAILAAGERVNDFTVVPVTAAVATASRLDDSLAFDSTLTGAGLVSTDTIAVGDTLSITIWESPDAGILSSEGQRVAALDEIRVGETGDVFVPYAGSIRASGRSPEELRRAITDALAGQTPSPQVSVNRTPGNATSISVLGGVGQPGVYPIDLGTRRLSGVLAAAGGVEIRPDVAQVSLTRGGRSSRIWLQDLYDNPTLDVAVRPNDRIVVEEDRRSFTVLGASGRQARLPFSKPAMTALEALAAAGGLDANSANPTGIFIFRVEPPAIARAVTGKPVDTPQQIAYTIDFSTPEGLLAAREFVIRDSDTIYIAEAPVASWRRAIGIASSAVSFAGSAAAAEDLVSR